MNTQIDFETRHIMLVLKTQRSANFRKCVLTIRRMDYVDTLKKGDEN